MLPPVHILIPAYNVETFVQQPIQSIQEQSYKNIKTFIHNDASTDNTIQTAKNLIDGNPNFIFSENHTNKGIASSRASLIKTSKAHCKDAFFLWLDADDYYTDPDFVAKFVDRMQKTQADVCLYNFDIRYESPDVIPNAAGLLKDKAHSETILDDVAATNDQTVSIATMPKIGTFTSLGWTKGYAPTAKWPQANENGIFEDFVYMSALYTADKVTAFGSDYKPLSYLRRANSLTGNRTPQTFTDVTTRIGEFLGNVANNNPAASSVAQEFAAKKIDQYGMILKQLVENGSNVMINSNVLEKYKADSLKLGIDYD